jgi:hypothetical protein
MPFVGIVTSKKTEKEFKKIENSIIVSSENADSLKNVKFEVLIINGKINFKEELIKRIISNSKIILINADLKNKINIEDKVIVITYGLNSKATVTASSLEDEIIICIQRCFNKINDEMVEPQEIKIKKGVNIYCSIVKKLLEIVYNRKN